MYYFCERPCSTSECPNCSTTSSTQAAGGPKHGEVFVILKTNSTHGAELRTCLEVGRAPSAKATISQRDHHPTDKFWVDGSGASESMIADATVFENYERAPPCERVGSADGKFSQWQATDGCASWWTKRTAPPRERRNSWYLNASPKYRARGTTSLS